MGIKHKSKYQVGDRINDSFELIENFSRKTIVKGKNEWLWKCKCDCGNEFNSREHKLNLRKGCQSCTNSINQTELALNKANGVEHIGLKNRLFKEYKSGANKRDLCFELSFNQFIELMNGNCEYCGEIPSISEYQKQYMQKKIQPWAHNGIDRIDSSIGYTLENCVSCCSKCNYAKHEMSLNEFKDWIVKVNDYLILKGSSTITKGSTLEANASGNGETPNS